MSLTDVLRIARSKTGTLYLYSALGGRSIELALHNNHLLSLYIDGFAVQDRDRATHTVLQLLSDAHGKFSFEDLARDRLARHYLLPLFPLLQQAAVQHVVPDVNLPHPQTMFRLRPGSPEVPAGLATMWQQASPHLKHVTNAELLSQILSVPQHDAQVMMYQLRSAALIELAHQHTPGNPSKPAQRQSPPATVVTSEARTMLQRLLGRLRGQGV
ncbi:hypothetical protein [Deinococcus aquiradiocola]|nr:hypothetical protein [Deinococcus aquiradiocola]